MDDRLQKLLPERFVIPHAYGTDTEPWGPAFEGYWSGERVDGWAIAYFTKEQGLKIVECSLEVMAGVPYYRGRYSPDTDAFVFNDGHNPLEIYCGTDYIMDGATVRLYNIGGRGRWIWQTAPQFGLRPSSR